MAITITSELTYANGGDYDSPSIDQYGVKHATGGYNTAYKIRYVTVYTCKTTLPLTQLTLNIRMSGNDGTSNNKYLAMIVTTTKNDSYLTTTPTFSNNNNNLDYSFLRFDYTCTDGGSFVNNTDSSNHAIGIVNATIPAGTFYVYVMPAVGTSYNTFSTWYSRSSDTYPATFTGTEVSTFTLKINPNGGTYSGSSAIHTSSTKLVYGGTTHSSIAPLPVRTGYTFMGYYTAASGGTQLYNSSGVCIKGTSYWNSSGKYCYPGDMTLYAQWKLSAVIYIDNGSSWDAYQCYIDNGSSWELYTPYIDNGSSWDAY